MTAQGAGPAARGARAALVAALLLAAGGCPGGDAPATRPAAPGAPRPTVVTPAPALAEILCALGAGAHVVGVSRYCRHPPLLAALPQIGGMIDPNLEAIDALAPDLILVQGHDARVLELAARRSIRVETFRIETIDELLAAVRRVGALVAREAAAEAEVARLRGALDAARAAAPARAPRTLLVFGHRPGELDAVSAPGSGTFLAECLAAAGGASCVADLPPLGWHVLAPEALVERAPDLIVELQAEPAAVTSAVAAGLRADWQALPGIPAVREGRIAIVAGEEVLIPGPRLDALLGKLGRAVRGELDVR